MTDPRDMPEWRRGLATDRLLVRPIDASDEALFCGLYSDAETMRFIGEPLSWKRAGRWFHGVLADQQQDLPPCVFYAILEKGSQPAIGICAIARFDQGMTRAEVGIVLESNARSKGYAREGLGALVGLVFRSFPVNEVWVRCSSLNPVVERMVASIGFVVSDEPETEPGPLLARTWSILRPAAVSTQSPT